MVKTGNDANIVSTLSDRHGVSEDAVRTVLNALRSGGGRMAQFSHPDFGGMAQWSSGMTMVGDMFNDRMKATLNALASDLVDYLRDAPAPEGASKGNDDVSYRSSRSPSDWWPDGLGSPASSGSQNHMRYAIFPNSSRLVIDDGGRVTVYDTGDHRISGISQAQSTDSRLTFTSQNGLVKVSELEIVERS
ncbi:hypothetical protein [Iodidimonas sp. SYSU 1G8]|uniref:hypothetical protein n=1 Tax=Iodidimonas sp. SYSU 1G8 TaxID=3133967 RepID=UPI0031FEDEE3